MDTASLNIQVHRYAVLRQHNELTKLFGVLLIFILIRIILKTFPATTTTIIISIFIISFMQGIYTYILETNYIPREYSVVAILLLLFMVLITLVSVLNLLYFYISTFRSIIIIIDSF